MYAFSSSEFPLKSCPESDIWGGILVTFFFLGRVLVFFLFFLGQVMFSLYFFLVESVFSFLDRYRFFFGRFLCRMRVFFHFYFLVFFYKFPPLIKSNFVKIENCKTSQDTLKGYSQNKCFFFFRCYRNEK